MAAEKIMVVDDEIGKPIDFEELHVTIKNALEATSLRTEVQTLRSYLGNRLRRIEAHI